MRLHRLTMTAFGPFGGTVEVDFDALAEAGLFLLSGATGSGKSSLLDGVCFGLYGRVPGERQQAGRLRSDFAPADAAPEVVLEVSLRGRRFRLTRSPAWERPKRRGSGTTSVRARALLQERGPETASTWVTLAHRLDEVGDQVSELMGMSLTQFTQVALLPQGQFQRFLAAGSQERGALLEAIFRTRRFRRIEQWLVDRRLEAGRADSEAHARVAAALHRFLEAAGEPLPEAVSADDLRPAVEDGVLEPWLGSVLDDLSRRREEATAESAAAGADLATAEAGLAEARERARERGRAAAAETELRRLEEARETIAGDRAVVTAAERAAAVVPLVRRSERAGLAAEQRRSDWESAWAAAVARLRRHHGPPDYGDPLDAAALAEAHRDVVTRAGLARALLPHEHQLDGHRERLRDLDQRLEQGRTVLAELEQRVESAPALLQQRQRELAETRTQAADVVPAATELTAAESLVDDAGRVDRLAHERDRLAAEVAALSTRALAAKEHWLEVREARLGSMAAHLAAGLAVGGDCPVCGSADHPRPARPGEAHVDGEAEDDALRLRDDAEIHLHAARDSLTGVEIRLREVRERVGDASLEQADARATAARRRHRTALQATERQERLAGAVTELADRQRRDAERLATTRTDEATLRAQRGALAERVADAEAEIATVLAGHDVADSVAALVREHEATGAALERARDALRDHHEAAAAAADAAREARAAAIDTGFATLDEVRAAALDVAGLDAVRARVQDHDRRAHHARAVLAEPGVRSALEQPEPPVGELERAHEAAVRHQQQRATSASAAAARHDRAVALAGELRRRLAAWEPVRERADLTSTMAALAEGKGPHNSARVSLSAYVLGERLGQVVAAANERLATMLPRYRLQHVLDTGGARGRGGLGLTVLDDYNGVARAPGALSGGETFVVSLALALGLADVVGHETGGTDIDTLFVDEGFGSLDADTLEHVLDTLDALRDGGRVVGVVSHVAEMRSRITAQVHVEGAGSAGSTVRTPALGVR